MAETHIVAAAECCLTPQALRLLSNALVCSEGVSFDGAYASDSLAVTAEGAGMNIVVAAGSAFIEGEEFAGEGMYFVSNDAPVVLTVPPADPADPRCDIVVAQISDVAEGQCWQLAIIEGVPAPQPTCPAVPDSAIQLAEITVLAGATTIDDSAIEDTRQPYEMCSTSSDWKEYTPTFNTGSVDSVIGWWSRDGETVHVRVQLHITSMPSAFTCTVPVTGTSDDGWTAGWLLNLGNAVARRDPASGANVFVGHVLNHGSGGIQEVTVVGTEGAPGGQWNAAVPFEWQDGALIGLNFWYRAA